MTAYVVIDLDIATQDGFREYVEGAGPLIERFGGRNIVTDDNALVLEGDWTPPTVVIHEFPDRETVQRFWDSPEYQPLKELRRKHSTVKVVVAQNPA
ncbi:DUF1330 domain-containing protein [Micromonospora sp. 4G57]|uniref:DUF1330 domain-containing protein n=1 Tax=Micromonospora sicca TaxID=2202420 RepID=A0ABU5JLX2_9ACTN|nr:MULTISPECIES: DUF1330 domain-containing protein [unclassified Micromonospora]MDZ5446948.1 DUF1330 domain-containing protein [Micromonospora sp. 4G57]MDZ5493625.1 DUF1330 domain-containing protein [Micromonospora sp. 4G53]